MVVGKILENLAQSGKKVVMILPRNEYSGERAGWLPANPFFGEDSMNWRLPVIVIVAGTLLAESWADEANPHLPEWSLLPHPSAWIVRGGLTEINTMHGLPGFVRINSFHSGVSWIVPN